MMSIIYSPGAGEQCPPFFRNLEKYLWYNYIFMTRKKIGLIQVYWGRMIENEATELLYIERYYQQC